MAEEKTRIHTRLSPETEQKMNSAFPKSNCQSRNEFVEQAICFYSDYLSTQDVTEFLPPIFLQAMRGTLQSSEDRVSRLLFKLAVETSMMMNVLAAGLEIDDRQLDALRWRCVQNVKKSNGSITFKDVVQEKKYGGAE